MAKPTIKILEGPWMDPRCTRAENPIPPTLNVRASVNDVEESFHEIPIDATEFNRLRNDKGDGAASDYLYEEVEAYAKAKQRHDEIALTPARTAEATRKGDVIEGFTGERDAKDATLDPRETPKAPVEVETKVTGTPTDGKGATPASVGTPVVPEKSTGKA